tara:strand:- start:4810 stop:5250 length:441 start_codon:yes stop_codon:yes gene_type:complete
MPGTNFCKICRDAGESHRVYTGHNIRSMGQVVCPTLLQTECRYCRQKGHTPKFCPKLKEKKHKEITPTTKGYCRSSGGTHRVKPSHYGQTMKTTKLVQNKEKGVKKSTSRFQMLNSDNDSDSDLEDFVFKIDPNAPKWGDSDDEIV